MKITEIIVQLVDQDFVATVSFTDNKDVEDSRIYVKYVIDKLLLNAKVYYEEDDPTGDIYGLAASNANNTNDNNDGGIIIDSDNLFELYFDKIDDIYEVLELNGLDKKEYRYEQDDEYNHIYECIKCTKNLDHKKINDYNDFVE